MLLVVAEEIVSYDDACQTVDKQEDAGCTKALLGSRCICDHCNVYSRRKQMQRIVNKKINQQITYITDHAFKYRAVNPLPWLIAH